MRIIKQIMKDLILFFKHLFSNSTAASSRRFVTVITTFVVLYIALIDLHTEKQINQYIFEGLMWIVLGGLGLLTSEKFASKKPPEPPNDFDSPPKA